MIYPEANNVILVRERPVCEPWTHLNNVTIAEGLNEINKSKFRVDHRASRNHFKLLTVLQNVKLRRIEQVESTR